MPRKGIMILNFVFLLVVLLSLLQCGITVCTAKDHTCEGTIISAMIASGQLIVFLGLWVYCAKFAGVWA